MGMTIKLFLYIQYPVYMYKQVKGEGVVDIATYVHAPMHPQIGSILRERQVCS